VKEYFKKRKAQAERMAITRKKILSSGNGVLK
jgi:hypothetical protein